MADKFQRSMKWPGLDDTYYFLPLVSEDDNGKVMTVKDGEWAAGDEQVSFDTEASGKTIILDDAADRPLRGLRIFGKTTQETTTGKNLFDPSQVNTLGFSDSTTITSLSNCRGYYMPIVAGTTYTVSRRNTSDFNRFRLGFTVDVPAASVKLIDTSINRDTTKVITTQAPANANYLVLYFSNASETITGEMVQIEVGAAATEWELYTGGIQSPNPDYPQPLISVGDDGAVEVMVAGKNLYSGGDLSFTHNKRVVLECPLMPGTYNVGALVESEATDASTSRVIFLDANNADSGSANLARGTRSVVRKVLTKPIYTLTFWAGNTSTTSTGKACTWENIMISREGDSTDYEPYKGQTLTFSTPNGLPSVGDVCDEIDLERGLYVQRVKRFSLPVATMNNSEDYPGWGYVEGLRECLAEGVNNFRYKVQSNVGSSIGVNTRGTNAVLWLDTGVYGMTQSEWMTNHHDLVVEIMLPLLTPIETPLSEEEIAAYKAAQTHRPITTIYNDESAEMHVRYANRNNFDEDAVLFRKQNLTDDQKAQILDNIGASSRLQVHDVSVATSLWADSTLYADYPYQALIPVSGATSAMYPDVVFDVAEALSGNYAPVADAADGGVLIYAKVVPEADIVVPTVTLWK